ncbi:hypothetical protein Tsubulata_009748 [Turnera subulata]|uniref:3-dehydroquinate synthase domain-containing protein n=1 Tax=Turnera subulata TaxID=218843 RepID=A0A9Q0F3D9_9ROSI|nr:hypothetical protein Tsubulata_009748 [Turnera subulata]
MAALLVAGSFLGYSKPHRSSFTLQTGKGKSCRLFSSDYSRRKSRNREQSYYLYHYTPRVKMCASSTISASTTAPDSYDKSKRVWIWTESQQVMAAAVERGWNTFLFSSKQRQLASDWSSIAFIYPLFVEGGEVVDRDNKRVATIFEVSTPQELLQLLPEDAKAENFILDLLDWQVIPAENIVAAFQGSQKTVFAISKTPLEAQVFLEVLEHGLGGVIMKSEDVESILELKGYFDRRNEASNLLGLTKATVTQVQVAGMGDRVCVDLCSLMRPGEGLLVGSFARGLFLVHSECLESNYIASRPFRVNAGPVHAYVSVPGGKTCYLSELKAGKEVLVVDQKGQTRTAIVGRVKIETRSLILVEAKIHSDDQDPYSIFLQNAETVALVPPCQGSSLQQTSIPVTSLKVGDEILLRVQGGARHTGIEIQEFVVER